MNRVGHVTPWAPGLLRDLVGAHGVTCPTWFMVRGSPPPLAPDPESPPQGTAHFPHCSSTKRVFPSSPSDFSRSVDPFPNVDAQCVEAPQATLECPPSYAIHH